MSIYPILNTSKISNIFKFLQSIHVEEIIPQIMHMVDMRHKILASSFKGISISKADIAFTIALILDLLFGVTLLSEFIDDNSCKDVGQQNLKESPINQIRNKPAIIVLLLLPIHAFSDDVLCKERYYTSYNRIAVLI